MRRELVVFLLLALLPLVAAPTCRWGPRLPVLVAASPPDGAESVGRSAWLQLEFADPVDPAAAGAQLLVCDGVPIPLDAYPASPSRLVLQPEGLLPPEARCQLVVGTTAGVELLELRTAPGGSSFEAVYDRTDPERPLPFPDDFFLASDPARPTGLSLDLRLPSPSGTASLLLGNVAAVAAAESDGWSPVGNLTVQLSSAPAPGSLPGDRAASLDPTSSVALLDLTPGSPTYGERISFKLVPRSDTFPSQPVAHALVLWPGIPLEPEGTYGLVVTDRVLDGAGQRLVRSAFFDAVVAEPQPGEPPEVTATRPLAEEVLQAAEALAPVPIPRDDVALAVRLTVRSTDHLPDELIAMREDVLATPPSVQIEEVSPGFGPLAAQVRGTFVAPSWGDTARVTRGADGLPEAVGTRTLPFVLALPAAAADEGRAPLVMYQHGNPGSAENEVPSAALGFLGAAGYAVAGFTDPLNRQLPTLEQQQLTILGATLFDGRAPDFYVRTYAEQMAFFQALESLDSLDVLPVGAPDGVPDLDPTTIVYEGISEGSNHGQAFLAYEPGVKAAALVVGSLRFAEMLEHQDRTTPTGGAPLLQETLPDFVSGLRVPDLWMGLSLFAITHDRQDPQNHARFLYREPATVDGTTRRASVLVVEGIGDNHVPNNASRSLAWQLGRIPQLAPIVRVPDLPLGVGPVQGNVDPDTTAAFVHYAPAGTSLPTTPGCSLQLEGHFCAQTAAVAREHRLDFYGSALAGVPVIGTPVVE